MKRRYDAVIIGGGLNGLTSAAYLARAGLEILVVERNSVLGGLDAGYEIAPGFKLPRFKLTTTKLPSRVLLDLDLARHGLRHVYLDGEVSLFESGGYLANYRNGSVHRRELARWSVRDVAAWTGFRRRMLHGAQNLTPILRRVMPDVAGHSMRSLFGRLKAVNRISEKSSDHLADLSRLWSQSCAELLSEYFESGEIQAHLSGAAMRAGVFGPHSPTSARLLINPYLQENGDVSAGVPAQAHVLGGASALCSALSSAITAYGGEIRTEAEVTDILLRNGSAYGVVLANGEEILANALLSDLDAKRTFLSLMPWQALPPELIEHAARFRMSGSVAKINLALDGVPACSGIPADCPALLGGVRLALTMQEMEAAFDDWRDGIPPRNPLIEAHIPSLCDPSLAPDGQHAMSVMVQYVPEELHDGPWTERRKEMFEKLVLSRLERHFPGLSDRVIACDVLMPPDIEAEAGVTSGDLMQGEATLDQLLFNRPSWELAGYRSPIRNLYMCSDSTHPGQLMPGGSGAQAAALLLSSLKRRKG